MSCPGESSGLITTTAGAAVSNVKQGVLQAATVLNGTLTIYDGTSTSGRLLAKLTAGATETVSHHIDGGTSFMVGLFVVLTGGEAVVSFRRGA